ncbi:MAG: hypothetical protein ACYC7E_08160 [Armatimonadota bacterium]
MCYRYFRLFIPLLLLTCGLAVNAAEPFANVFPNGSFEDTTPVWSPSVNDPAKTGAAVILDTQQVKEGRQAAKLSLPGQGAANLSSPLAPVEADKDYLFTLWYRSEGFSKTNLFAGVNASYHLTWYNAQKKALGQIGIGLPYGARPEWALHIRMLTVPKDAAFLGMSLSMSAGEKCLPSALWIDRIQLRHWTGELKPGGKTVTFFVGTQGYFTQSVFRKVWDDDAADGFAAVANTRFMKDKGYLAGSMYTKLLPPGAYRVTFRAKVGALAPERKPVLQWDINTAGTANLRDGVIYTTDFQAAKTYQDFTYRFVVTPTSGWVDFRAFWTGEATAWIDTVTVREEKIFTEDDLKKLLG